MPKKTHPLELVLRAHGPIELLNANEEMLWVSDSDDDFREEFNNEFLQEEDIGDVLEFLLEYGIINDSEFKRFESDQWDCIIESQSAEEPGDNDEEEEEFEDGEIEE